MELNKFEELPMEIIIKIFNYFPLEDILTLKGVCKLFRAGVGLTVRQEVVNLVLGLKNRIGDVQQKLLLSPLKKDNLRLLLVKSLMHLRYLQTELSLLYATVWQYKEDLQAWSFLVHPLCKIVEEFWTSIDKAMVKEPREFLYQCSGIMNPGLKHWFRFARAFNAKTEQKIAKGSSPFLVKVIDVLCCCPSANTQMAVMSAGQDYDYVHLYFSLKEVKPQLRLPRLSHSQSNAEKEKEVLTFLRECVQWQNAVYLQKMVSDITDLELKVGSNFTELANMERAIESLHDRYVNIHCSPYTPVKFLETRSSTTSNEFYVRSSTSDVNKTDVTVTLKGIVKKTCVLNILALMRNYQLKTYDIQHVEDEENVKIFEKRVAEEFYQQGDEKTTSNPKYNNLVMTVHHQDALEDEPKTAELRAILQNCRIYSTDYEK